MIRFDGSAQLSAVSGQQNSYQQSAKQENGIAVSHQPSAISRQQ